MRTDTLTRRRMMIIGGGIAAASLAGCTGDDDDDDAVDNGDDDTGNDVDGDPDERVTSYLEENDAQLFDGSIADHTGESEITIAVGAGDAGHAFDPPAVRIDAGTTVIFEWTGEGGGHNVAPDGDSDFDDFGDSNVVPDAGHTIEDTFDEAGVALYVCEPHQGQGMYGGIVVE